MRNKDIKKAEANSQKLFNKLTNEFLEYLKVATEETRIDTKIQELNDRWLKQCDVMKAYMIPEGKNEFLRVAGLILRDIKKMHQDKDIESAEKLLP